MTHRPRSRRRWLVGVVLAAAAAVLASGVVAGQFRTTDPVAFERDLMTGEIVRVADIAAVDGQPARGVFVQATDGGQVCVWDAPSEASPQRGGGCNPAADPLGGGVVSANLAYEGGPAIGRVKDARLSGLASRDAARVSVVMSDGSRRDLKLRKAKVGSDEFQAFGYRIRTSDLSKGIGPVAIVAYDADGIEIGRQLTGIG